MQRAGYVDEIQSNMLSLIAGMMRSYCLTPEQVQVRYDYISTLTPDEITDRYVSPVQESIDELNAGNDSSDDTYKAWSDDEDDDEERPIYVKTRREFCNTMQRGVKICPRYSSCTAADCNNFHIRPEFICSHVTKGSYCDVEGCELIIIRPCRKGKRCKDNNCSFRH